MKYEIIGMGGVMTAADVEEYRDAGANVVQSVTGAASNVSLGVDVATPNLRGRPIRNKVARVLATGGLSLLTDR